MSIITITDHDEDNDTGVTVNMSLILDKLNKLIEVLKIFPKLKQLRIEKYIFIFIIIGIF